jgi:hypothetical protein
LYAGNTLLFNSLPELITTGAPMSHPAIVEGQNSNQQLSKTKKGRRYFHYQDPISSNFRKLFRTAWDSGFGSWAASGVYEGLAWGMGFTEDWNKLSTAGANYPTAHSWADGYGVADTWFNFQTEETWIVGPAVQWNYDTQEIVHGNTDNAQLETATETCTGGSWWCAYLCNRDCRTRYAYQTIPDPISIDDEARNAHSATWIEDEVHGQELPGDDFAWINHFINTHTAYGELWCA